MMMPGMDGEHLIQNVKQLNPNIKAILMSGYSNQFEKHTANTPLPFTFLTKPFVLDELLRLVQKVLQN
jgi:two-component system nitrogen regulation response regulator GlnG